MKNESIFTDSSSGENEKVGEEEKRGTRDDKSLLTKDDFFFLGVPLASADVRELRAL